MFLYLEKNVTDLSGFTRRFFSHLGKDYVNRHRAQLVSTKRQEKERRTRPK